MAWPTLESGLVSIVTLSSRNLHPTKAISHVDGGGRMLEDTECLDNGLGHTVLGLADVEVAQRTITRSVCDALSAIGLRLPLGLGTPVLVSGDL